MFGLRKLATWGGDVRPAHTVLPWQLTLALAVGILALAAYASASPEHMKTFVILFIVSGAAFLIGALVGFLFGIPKSRTDGSPRLADVRPLEESYKGSTRRERYWDNANLEEVSDWLTKIIVGLGLVEFSKLLDFFGKIGITSEPIIGNDGEIVLQGSLIYFLVLGFIFCYLWTRVVFYGILVDVDAIRQTVKEEVKEEVIRIETKSDDEFKINRVLNDLYIAIDVAKNTEFAKRDWGVLNQLGKQAKDIFNNNKLNRKAAILSARFVCEIQHDQTDVAGNEQAIQLLDEFLVATRMANKYDRDFADVLYDRACHSARIVGLAYLPAENPKMISHKQQMLESLHEAFKLAPDRAKLALTDPDFAPFHCDPDFVKAVVAAAPQQQVP